MVVKCFCERAAFPIGTRAPSELKAGLGIHVSYAYHSHVKASPERDEPSRHSKRGRDERWWTHAVTVVSAPSSSFSCCLAPEPIICDSQMFLPMPCLNLTVIINSSNLLRLG